MQGNEFYCVAGRIWQQWDSQPPSRPGDNLRVCKDSYTEYREFRFANQMY